MTKPPVWWQGIVAFGLVLGQVPFELAALHDIRQGRRRWIGGLPFYCVHVLSCMVPMFADLMMSSDENINRARTLIPKLMDLAAVLMLLVYARLQGALPKQQ